jgi:hypothetical protein
VLGLVGRRSHADGRIGRSEGEQGEGVHKLAWSVLHDLPLIIITCCDVLYFGTTRIGVVSFGLRP